MHQNLSVALTFLALMLGCLLFAYLVAERPLGLSLVDEECQDAQELYYRARERALAHKNEFPAYKDKDATEEHDHADVCAQHRMANAAEYGLILLFGSLAFAGFAAIMARRTVLVMRETAQQQLRTYVVVDDTEVREDEGRWLRGKLTIKNSGATPATNLRHWLGHCIRPHPLTERLPPQVEPPRTHGALGGDGTFIVNFERQFTAEELAAVLDGRKFRYHVFGTIMYDDVYGRPWDFLYSFTLGHDSMGDRHVLEWRATHHGPDRT